MGPSGCGKTTLIRCVNRMHELVPEARVEGGILVSGQDVYGMNPISVRKFVHQQLQNGQEALLQLNRERAEQVILNEKRGQNPQTPEKQAQKEGLVAFGGAGPVARQAVWFFHR